MTLIKQFAIVAIGLLLAPLARAHLELGNVAPGSAAVELRIDGTAVATPLGFLGFAKVERPNGPLHVAAVSTATGAVLAQGDFTLAPEAGVEPILLLVGNGEQRPYALELYQHAYKEDAFPVPINATNRALIAIHHLAPLAPPEHDPSAPWTVELRCEGSNVGGGGFSSVGGYGTLDWYYGTMRGTLFAAQHEQNQCTLAVTSARVGTLELTAPFARHRTLRLMLVGDGEREPFRLAAVDDGALLAVASPAAPTPGAVTRARDVWYDLNRPAQAVTLYEIPGGDDLLGFWFTHDAQGRSTWFYFDGVATGLPGQRDLVLYRLRASGTPVEEIGSARLFYLDCNNAELRVLSGERELHTLRLRRSLPVTTCAVLE